MISFMDSDADGEVSLHEAESYLRNVYNKTEGEIIGAELFKMDVNGDGILSYSEIDN